MATTPWSGGDTRDGVDFFFSPQAVVVDLTAGTATGDGTDTLAGIGQVFGSRHDDTITGDANANSLYGDRGPTRSPASPATTRWTAAMGPTRWMEA